MRKYAEFKDFIDVDAVAAELGIAETEQSSTEDKFTGFCPFPENHSHGDTTGKFAIFKESKVTHCYACGSRSLLALVMELKELDQDDAEAWLRKHALEDARSDPEFVEDFLNAFVPKERRRPSLPEFGPGLLEKRFSPLIDHMPEYLEARGISEEIANRYGLMYSPEYRVRGFANGETQEHVGPFIIFPHWFRERLVGWQARVVNQNSPCQKPSYPSWIPKYKNTSEFPKDQTLYGLDQAIRQKGPVLVAESAASVMYAQSLGIPAVGTFGAEPTKRQIKLLAGFQEVVLAEDNDKAGREFTDTLLTSLDNVLGTIKAPLVAQGSDVGDYHSLEGGDQRLLDLYKEARASLFSFEDL